MIATTLLLLIILLALSVPVAAVMGVLGLALNQFYASMPLHRAMGEIIWNSSSEYILIAIPLFVMLGEILLRVGIAERVYNGIAQWLSWLPGGLMHANIGVVRHVRGDLGLERRHRGDHRHRRDPRDQEAQLQRAAVPRHHRGRRHARHPHPAFDQLHPVRAADQLIGAAAVSRGLPAGLHARRSSSW